MKRNKDNFDELDRGVDSSQYGDDLVPRRHPVLRFLFKLCFLCFLACAIALTIWGYFLDREIRAALDSSRGRWHLPALVYARPLELSLNERITPEQMERELKLLHYRKAGTTMTQPGQYAIRKQGNSVNIFPPYLQGREALGSPRVPGGQVPQPGLGPHGAGAA